MTIAIVSLILISYFLIASEHFTKINKTTTAILTGVVAWILYLCMGGDFVYRMHGDEFTSFLDGRAYSSMLAKQYIAGNVFVVYAEYISSIVLYLLTTMSIVEVLSNNGCFDFIKDIVRARNTNRVLWGFVLITFLFSANFDNLTTVVLMLGVMRSVLQSEVQRRYVGAAIVVAACCGGCVTVIGDVASLMLWTKEAVTPTDFSASMVLPAIVGTVIPTLLIRKSLPDHLDIQRSRFVGYRTEETAMPLWQRISMLVVGVMGLWFVPSFHRITLLPPFLGALCVLAVLWLLNEIFNRRSIQAETPMMLPGTKRRLHNEVYQVIMYFVGVALAVSVLREIGAMRACGQWIDTYIHDAYVFSIFIGFVSAFMDNICLVFSAISIYDVTPFAEGLSSYQQIFMQNGQYWHLVIISGCLGGCLLPIGSVAGYAFMKSEDISMSWYFRKITGKVLLGWMFALVTYFMVDYLLR